jgi:hypothetical protein
MSFTTKQGRNLLLKRHRLPKVVERKWAGVLPSSFKFRWKNVWDKDRVRKEANLV